MPSSQIPSLVSSDEWTNGARKRCAPFLHVEYAAGVPGMWKAHRCTGRPRSTICCRAGEEWPGASWLKRQLVRQQEPRLRHK